MSDTFLHEERLKEVSRTQAVVMGVAASGIAFAMHQTADDSLTVAMVPILAAVLCWAASFSCGILNSHAKQAAIGMNVGKIEELRSEKRPTQVKAFSEAFDKYNQKSRNLYSAQLVLLLAGAMLYVGGHVWMMYEQEAEAKRASVHIQIVI